jgi:hypothetical protein
MRDRQCAGRGWLDVPWTYRAVQESAGGIARRRLGWPDPPRWRLPVPRDFWVCVVATEVMLIAVCVLATEFLHNHERSRGTARGP